MNLKKLLIQIIKFGFVGIVAAIVDVALLVLLKEIFHIDIIISSAISFTVSVIVNYILSMSFVFEGKKQSKIKEFAIFVLLSIGGLCINQAIMWFGVEIIDIYYLAVKIFAMIFVPVYNFVTRKIFLETKAS